jgi:hypothetical protein
MIKIIFVVVMLILVAMPIINGIRDKDDNTAGWS